MAWFDPPLYKPGNKKCPNCGKHQGWAKSLGLNPEWVCPACNSVLTLDLRRKSVARVALITVAAATGLMLAALTDWGRISVLFAVPVIMAVLTPVWYWTASIQLRSIGKEEERSKAEDSPRSGQEEQKRGSKPPVDNYGDRAIERSVFCPKCRIEYQEWVGTCRYCKVDTVAELPAGARPKSQDVDPYPYKRWPHLELGKLGNRRCPNCGKHQGWYRAWGPYRWQVYPCEWKCSECQTVLTYDYNRSHVLKAATVVPLVLGLLLFMGCLALPILCIFLPIPIIAAVLVYWSSVSIIRRDEFDRVLP